MRSFEGYSPAKKDSEVNTGDNAARLKNLLDPLDGAELTFEMRSIIEWYIYLKAKQAAAKAREAWGVACDEAARAEQMFEENFPANMPHREDDDRDVYCQGQDTPAFATALEIINAKRAIKQERLEAMHKAESAIPSMPRTSRPTYRDIQKIEKLPGIYSTDTASFGALEKIVQEFLGPSADVASATDMKEDNVVETPPPLTPEEAESLYWQAQLLQAMGNYFRKFVQSQSTIDPKWVENLPSLSLLQNICNRHETRQSLNKTDQETIQHLVSLLPQLLTRRKQLGENFVRMFKGQIEQWQAAWQQLTTEVKQHPQAHSAIELGMVIEEELLLQVQQAWLKALSEGTKDPDIDQIITTVVDSY